VQVEAAKCTELNQVSGGAMGVSCVIGEVLGEETRKLRWGLFEGPFMCIEEFRHPVVGSGESLGC
jgi:hypothetical protein